MQDIFEEITCWVTLLCRVPSLRTEHFRTQRGWIDLQMSAAQAAKWTLRVETMNILWMEEILHQLKTMLYPIISRVWTPRWCRDFFHLLYQKISCFLSQVVGIRHLGGSNFIAGRIQKSLLNIYEIHRWCQIEITLRFRVVSPLAKVDMGAVLTWGVQREHCIMSSLLFSCQDDSLW